MRAQEFKARLDKVVKSYLLKKKIRKKEKKRNSSSAISQENNPLGLL
jgi:hypothetical protein